MTAEVLSAHSTGPCVSRSEDPKHVLTSRGTPQSRGALGALQSAGTPVLMSERASEWLLFRLESWEGTVCALKV